MLNRVSLLIRFAGIGLVGLVLLSITIWVPIKQASGLPKAERIQAETAARDVLIKGLGGSLVFITAFIGWENLKSTQKSISVAEEKQITERFSKAVEMIGNEHSIHLRLGGIYALERIAKDSERDQQQVMEILAAFVRVQTSSSIEQDSSRPYHYKSLDTLRDEQWEQEQDYYQYLDDPDDCEMFILADHTYTRSPSIDIQAAVSVIGRRVKTAEESKGNVIDMSQATLKDIVFSGNYDQVNFYGTHFISPIFRENTSFRGADLSETFIENLRADNVSMAEATFKKSVIIASRLSKINLNDACFSEVEFSGGTVLEQCDFSRASLNSLKIGHPVPTKPRNKNSNVMCAQFEERSEFKQVNFDEVEMTYSSLDDAVFELSSFENANLEGSTIRGVDFKHSNLTDVCLKHVSFGRKTVEGPEQKSETEAKYRLDSQYKPSRLKARVSFNGSNLQGADLSDARINKVDFETANNLSASQVKKAHKWEGAKYSLSMKEKLGLM